MPGDGGLDVGGVDRIFGIGVGEAADEVSTNLTARIRVGRQVGEAGAAEVGEGFGAVHKGSHPVLGVDLLQFATGLQWISRDVGRDFSFRYGRIGPVGRQFFHMRPDATGKQGGGIARGPSPEGRLGQQ